MKRDLILEASIVEKYAIIVPVLDERGRRRWAAAESRAIGYGGDSVVSAATGLARQTIRNGRQELRRGLEVSARIRRPGAGRPSVQKTQPGIKKELPPVHPGFFVDFYSFIAKLVVCYFVIRSIFYG